MTSRLNYVLSVENKCYEFKLDKFGVRVGEKHHGRRWEINLLKDDFVWWINELVQIWRNPGPSVRTRRAPGFVLILRLCRNSQERFFTLEKLLVGGSVAIRVPEGAKGAGWNSVIDVAQKIGPFVQFMGKTSATVASESERLICRNCGSRDIIEELPEVAVERDVVDATEREGGSYGRREISACNQGAVILEIFLLFQFQLQGRD